MSIHLDRALEMVEFFGHSIYQVALRTPTDEMIEAAQKATGLDPADIKAIYAAMLNAYDDDTVE